MADQQNNVITIDGTEYNYDELADNVKYCIAQINDLRGQLDGARARVDQLNMAHDGFINLLKLEMQKANEESGQGELDLEQAS